MDSQVLAIGVCVGRGTGFGDSEPPSSVHKSSLFVFPLITCLERKMSKANQLQNPGGGWRITSVAGALLRIAQRKGWGDLLPWGDRLILRQHQREQTSRC